MNKIKSERARDLADSTIHIKNDGNGVDYVRRDVMNLAIEIAEQEAESNDPNILGVAGDFLKQAVKWFNDNDIPLYGIQTNPTQHEWTTSPKSYAEIMIDDSALGCPLKYDGEISLRPFVDWEKVRELLIVADIL